LAQGSSIDPAASLSYFIPRKLWSGLSAEIQAMATTTAVAEMLAATEEMLAGGGYDSSEDEQVSPLPKTDDKEKKDKKKQSLPEGFESRSEYKAYLGAKKAFMEKRPFEPRKHKGAVEKAMKDVKEEMTKMQTHLTNEGKKNTEQLTSEGKMKTAFLAEHSNALHGALATAMDEKFQELKGMLAEQTKALNSGSRGSQDAVPTSLAIENGTVAIENGNLAIENGNPAIEQDKPIGELTETELQELLKQKKEKQKEEAAEKKQKQKEEAAEKKRQDREEAARVKKRAKLEAELAMLD